MLLESQGGILKRACPYHRIAEHGDGADKGLCYRQSGGHADSGENFVGEGEDLVRMTKVELEQKDTKSVPEEGQQEPSPIERLLELGQGQGYVTYDDVMEAVPAAELNIEQLEDVLATLMEMGVELSDSELEEPEPPADMPSPPEIPEPPPVPSPPEMQ